MIQLVHISKSFGDQELFSDINFTLGRGNRVGFVGRNGSGKSTLFKIITGELSHDMGEVVIPKGYRIGTLKQHLEFHAPTLREEAALALPESMQYEVYRVEKILFGLGFSEEDLDKSPLSFSGGYQIRINLAKLLVTEPNLLLLDEPTNYLDIVSMRWLKSFLRSFQGEVILITHDRDFMDAVSTHTMGLVRRDLFVLSGDTHKFYEQLKENDTQYEKQKIAQDKKRKELEEFIARNKARASTAALAQSKVKQLEKLEDMDDLGFDPTLKFDFTFKPTTAKVLLELENVSFGYDPTSPLFSGISFMLEPGQCLGIIGKNGKGKSTLLNVIAGELKAQTGTIELHPSGVLSHFGQTNIARLNPAQTIMDAIYEADPKQPANNVRAICGAMMFSGDRAEKKISLLSGGEKSRVMLGQILSRPTNVLLLDEPTNHLDIDSIEALTKAIHRFKGAVILVTHSEELLRKVATRLVVFAHGSASYFDDGYDAFLEKIGWEEEEENTSKKSSKPKMDKKEQKRQRAALISERTQATAELKKEVTALEAHIVTNETKLAALQTALATATKAQDNAQVLSLSKEISTLEAQIEHAFDTMAHAQEQLDTLLAQFEAKLASLERI